MRKNISFALLLIIIATLQYACKRCNDPSNPDCKNYDPCFGKTAASADFDIFERNGWKGGSNWIEVKSDTIIYRAFGVFRAKQSPDNDIEYSWKIGFMDKEFTEPEVRLQFMEDVFGQTIPIRLIVTKKQGQTCITNPIELKDTVIKYLHVTSPMRSRIFGKFEGEELSEDGTFKKYTLEIVPTQDLWDVIGPETIKTISFKNINDLGCYEESYFEERSYLFHSVYMGLIDYYMYCQVNDTRIARVLVDSLRTVDNNIYIKYKVSTAKTGQSFSFGDWKIFRGNRIN